VCQLLGRVIIINGDAGCGLLAAYIIELVAQDSWLRPKVDSVVNRANSYINS